MDGVSRISKRRRPLRDSSRGRMDGRRSVAKSASSHQATGPCTTAAKTVKWYSDNEDVAAVDQNGTITAKRVGTVDIYAVSDDGYFKATCHVEVR